MTGPETTGEYGWFHYGGRRLDRERPDFLGVDLPLPREADDPPFVVWQQDATTWVVDDDERDGYFHIHGFTRDQIIGAVRFAWAMDWLKPERTRPALIRRIGTPGEQTTIN